MLTVVVNYDRIISVMCMELLQLKYFCDSAETENFTVTAKKYGVPVSGISQTVKRLEEEIGVSLFERSANRIALSRQGEIFYGEIKKALEHIENAKAGVLDAEEEISGEIKISVLTNRRIVTRAIESFKAEFKKVSFLINHNPRADLKDFDLIISDEAEKRLEHGFSKELLLTENIVVAINKDNPLAEEKSLSVDRLKEQRFITMPKESSLHRQTLKICSFGGFEPNIAIQSDDPFYVRKYVELGLGVAFVPDYSWQGLFSEKVVLKKIGNYRRNTCIFKTKEKYKSKATEIFAEKLLALAKDQRG